MSASLQATRRVKTLLVLFAVMATAAAAFSATSAAAASTSYYASFPPGECRGNTIVVSAPSTVSSWAGDTKIAWRALIWRASNGVWVYDNKLPVQYAQVVGGQVYAPYGQGGTFTINRAGAYAVTVEVYSYGLGKWFKYDLMLRVSDAFGYEYETGWCRFG